MLKEIITKDGFAISKNFLSRDNIDSLNSEIESLSKKFIFNGNSVGTVWFNKNYYDVYNPITNINSINLLETSVSVAKLIFSKNFDNFRLTNLRVSVEKKNAYPLDWHKDNMNNVFRAILYLDEVNETNGSLSIVKGSHLKKNDDVKHKVNLNDKEKKDIQKLNCAAGDIIFFDPNIYHKKNSVSKIRRSIMFEFQHKDTVSNKYVILLDNSKINKTVLDNFKIFETNNQKSKYELNVYSNKIPDNTPLIIYFNLIVKKLFRKIIN